jgi:hypothetical protein
MEATHITACAPIKGLPASRGNATMPSAGSHSAVQNLHTNSASHALAFRHALCITLSGSHVSGGVVRATPSRPGRAIPR